MFQHHVLPSGRALPILFYKSNIWCALLGRRKRPASPREEQSHPFSTMTKYSVFVKRALLRDCGITTHNLPSSRLSNLRLISWRNCTASANSLYWLTIPRLNHEKRCCSSSISQRSLFLPVHRSCCGDRTFRRMICICRTLHVQ